jgi:hypothetical protein
MNFTMEKQYAPFKSSALQNENKTTYISPYEENNKEIVTSQSLQSNNQYRQFLINNSRIIVKTNSELYKKA